MTYVATLICDPHAALLGDDTLALAQDALSSPGAPDWLDPRIAADIAFSPIGEVDSRALAEHVRAAIGELAVDIVVQPTAQRRKGLFVADMDSTMIGQECIDEMADFVGLKARVAAITARAMRGEVDFEPALRERVALLRGLRAEVIEQVLRERICLNPGARTLVATMREHGTYTCLVSGGFTAFVERIAQLIGFDESRSNVLQSDNGILSGLVREPILGREAKLAALIELRERRALAKEQTLAVGDGANDLAMLLEAGLGVAYRAKPHVAAATPARIDHGDLTALLYLQGYRRGEFADS